MENHEPPFEPKKINYLTWLLVAAVACMFYIIYQKGEERRVQENNTIEQIKEPTK